MERDILLISLDGYSGRLNKGSQISLLASGALKTLPTHIQSHVKYYRGKGWASRIVCAIQKRRLRRALKDKRSAVLVGKSLGAATLVRLLSEGFFDELHDVYLCTVDPCHPFEDLAASRHFEVSDGLNFFQRLEAPKGVSIGFRGVKNQEVTRPGANHWNILDQGLVWSESVSFIQNRLIKEFNRSR
jgi:hypothetical protein